MDQKSRRCDIRKGRETNLEVKILATGSSGNCVLADGKVLIDAGISIKLLSSYGVVPEDLDALIITHKHGDHMKLPLVRYLLSAGVKAFLPTGVIAKVAEEGQLDITRLVALGQVTPITDNAVFEAGPITIRAYPQQHHDIINYAFVLTKGEDRLLYATDLDTLEPSDTGVGESAVRQSRYSRRPQQARSTRRASSRPHSTPTAR